MNLASPNDSPSVIGRPRFFLRIDGLVLLVGALLLFRHTHQHWWWIALLLFAPDLFVVGYAYSTRIGALTYNLGHSYLLPGCLSLYGWHWDRPLMLAIGLIWFAHIGMDRFAGYGLKYNDNFKHTHLGNLSKKQGSSFEQ